MRTNKTIKQDVTVDYKYLFAKPIEQIPKKLRIEAGKDYKKELRKDVFTKCTYTIGVLLFVFYIGTKGGDAKLETWLSYGLITTTGIISIIIFVVNYTLTRQGAKNPLEVKKYLTKKLDELLEKKWDDNDYKVCWENLSKSDKTHLLETGFKNLPLCEQENMYDDLLDLFNDVDSLKLLGTRIYLVKESRFKNNEHLWNQYEINCLKKYIDILDTI